jgi:hypothetical protein
MNDHAREAEHIAEKYISRLGLGFHPDTRGKDYVDSLGKRTFTAKEAAEYEADMGRLFEIAEPYGVVLSVMCSRGLI